MLPLILRFLPHPSPIVREITCWTLSRICQLESVTAETVKTVMQGLVASSILTEQTHPKVIDSGLSLILHAVEYQPKLVVHYRDLVLNALIDLKKHYDPRGELFYDAVSSMLEHCGNTGMQNVQLGNLLQDMKTIDESKMQMATLIFGKLNQVQMDIFWPEFINTCWMCRPSIDSSILDLFKVVFTRQFKQGAELLKNANFLDIILTSDICAEWYECVRSMWINVPVQSRDKGLRLIQKRLVGKLQSMMKLRPHPKQYDNLLVKTIIAGLQSRVPLKSAEFSSIQRYCSRVFPSLRQPTSGIITTLLKEVGHPIEALQLK